MNLILLDLSIFFIISFFISQEIVIKISKIALLIINKEFMNTIHVIEKFEKNFTCKKRIHDLISQLYLANL